MASRRGLKPLELATILLFPCLLPDIHQQLNSLEPDKTVVSFSFMPSAICSSSSFSLSVSESMPSSSSSPPTSLSKSSDRCSYNALNFAIAFSLVSITSFRVTSSVFGFGGEAAAGCWDSSSSSILIWPRVKWPNKQPGFRSDSFEFLVSAHEKSPPAL